MTTSPPASPALARPPTPDPCPPCAIRWGGHDCPRLASGVATYAARTLARFGQGPTAQPARSFPACATHGAEARRMASEGWTFEPYADRKEDAIATARAAYFCAIDTGPCPCARRPPSMTAKPTVLQHFRRRIQAARDGLALYRSDGFPPTTLRQATLRQLREGCRGAARCCLEVAGGEGWSIAGRAEAAALAAAALRTVAGIDRALAKTEAT